MTALYTSTYPAVYGGSGSLWLSYDPTLSRVLIDLAELRVVLGSDATADIQRSADRITWTTVRGASGVSITASALPFSDYEFVPGVTNFYRAATGADPVDSIIPDLTQPWLKSVRYPFLNRPVTISDVDDITRPGLSETFPVLGQAAQVAIPRMRGSRQTTITVATDTDEATDALVALLGTGDVLLVQVPAGYTVPLGGYWAAGDTVESRQSVEWSRRWTAIPVTEVVPPDPSVQPITGTWATVVADYADWVALAEDLGSWADVVSLVGAPGDVVVS